MQYLVLNNDWFANRNPAAGQLSGSPESTH